MMTCAEVIAEAARPPSVAERKQLALLALNLAADAVRAADLPMAEAFVQDAQAHLRAMAETGAN